MRNGLDDAQAQRARELFLILEQSQGLFAARQQALNEGQQKAMTILLERMTLKSDYARLPGLSPEEITEYIQDFSIAEEKSSSVRYLARLNYRFRPGEVRDLLRAFNIPFAETPSSTSVLRGGSRICFVPDPFFPKKRLPFFSWSLANFLPKTMVPDESRDVTISGLFIYLASI